MSWLGQLASRDREGRALGRHTFLLASLIFMMVALPLLEWSSGRTLRFPILFSLVLMAATWVNRTQHWVLVVAILTGIGALAGNALSVAEGALAPRIAGDLSGLALLVLTTFVILNSVVRTRRVELDTVIGGICVYLLIGLSFTTLYRLLLDLDPAAFMLGDLPLAEACVDASSLPARLLYFSFITLTTTGLGDIRPASEIAQMLTAGEALTGQLYVAIFVARLMGLHIEAGRLRTEPGDSDDETDPEDELDR
ncbi:MAG: two pore domain potassium channel family protein [Deltaproteobacteria bacterium]|nr:two pore domain potassium channel family protein [Deltaproteobacteria bacterium]